MVHEAFRNLQLVPSLQAHPRVHIQSPPSPQASKTTPPHPESQQGVPLLLHDYRHNRTSQGRCQLSQAYQKQCFKRMDNLERVKGRRKGRVSSQKKLARNLEEKSKGEHCHLENKAWVNFVPRHTNILPRQPQPVRRRAPHQ